MAKSVGQLRALARKTGGSLRVVTDGPAERRYRVGAIQTGSVSSMSRILQSSIRLNREGRTVVRVGDQFGVRITSRNGESFVRREVFSSRQQAQTFIDSAGRRNR